MVWMLIELISLNTTFTVNNQFSNITIDDLWVRSAPPNALTLGIFMEIYNHFDDDIKLLSANTLSYIKLYLKDSMIRIIKQDFIGVSGEQVQNLTTQWLLVYNNERPHFALSGIPPRAKVV